MGFSLHKVFGTRLGEILTYLVPSALILRGDYCQYAWPYSTAGSGQVLKHYTVCTKLYVLCKYVEHRLSSVKGALVLCV